MNESLNKCEKHVFLQSVEASTLPNCVSSSSLFCEKGAGFPKSALHGHLHKVIQFLEPEPFSYVLALEQTLMNVFISGAF